MKIKFKVEVGSSDVLEARIRRALKKNEGLTFTLIALSQIEPATVSDVWNKMVELFHMDYSRPEVFQYLIQLKTLKLVDRKIVSEVLSTKKNDKIIEKIKEKIEKVLNQMYGMYKDRFLSAYYYFTTDLADKFAKWIVENYPEIKLEGEK